MYIKKFLFPALSWSITIINHSVYISITDLLFFQNDFNEYLRMKKVNSLLHYYAL